MIPLWNVEELEAVLPDDCRVERKSARIDVRRGRVTTRIMDRLTGGDGVLASRHTSYMDIDHIVLPGFDAGRSPSSSRVHCRSRNGGCSGSRII